MMPRQYALPFDHVRDLSEARFIVAPSNEEAWAWLARTPDWPLHRFALSGPEGSGKSHLLSIWAERTGAQVVPGPQLRFETLPVRPVAIDDADLAPEQALFHVINVLAEMRLPLLLAARLPPARWGTALPDLASRLRATAAAAIGDADDTLLRALLARLRAERQLRVPAEMQDWLRLRLPRTQAAMHEAAAKLDRLTLHLRSGVTWPVARAVVEEAERDDSVSASPATASLL